MEITHYFRPLTATLWAGTSGLYNKAGCAQNGSQTFVFVRRFFRNQIKEKEKGGGGVYTLSHESLSVQ